MSAESSLGRRKNTSRLFSFLKKKKKKNKRGEWLALVASSSLFQPHRPPKVPGYRGRDGPCSALSSRLVVELKSSRNRGLVRHWSGVLYCGAFDHVSQWNKHARGKVCTDQEGPPIETATRAEPGGCRGARSSSSAASRSSPGPAPEQRQTQQGDRGGVLGRSAPRLVGLEVCV